MKGKLGGAKGCEEIMRLVTAGRAAPWAGMTRERECALDEVAGLGAGLGWALGCRDTHKRRSMVGKDPHIVGPGIVPGWACRNVGLGGRPELADCILECGLRRCVSRL